MGFTIYDYHDLVKLLKEHPDWQKELRTLLLPDELLALPEIVQQLVLAQQQTEEQLLRLEASVQRLVEQVASLFEGQDRILKRVNALEEGQKRLEDDVSELKKGQKELKNTVDKIDNKVGKLDNKVGKLDNTVGGLKGRVLEITYRGRAAALFGTRLRRPKIMELYTLVDTLEEALTPDEFDDIFRIDLVVAGKLRHVPDSPELLLAMEISSVVDRNDVSRAVHRASLLRKAGLHSVPVIAGEKVTEGASQTVREQNVAFVQDGHMELWNEAVARWADIQLSDDYRSL